VGERIQNFTTSTGEAMKKGEGEKHLREGKEKIKKSNSRDGSSKRTGTGIVS